MLPPADELIAHLLKPEGVRPKTALDLAGVGDALAPYRNNLIGGLAGATLGGGAMALGTNAEPGEDPAATRKRRLSNLLSGALAGGAAGAAAPTVAKMLPGAGNPDSTASKVVGYLNPMGNRLTGAGVGAATGDVAGRALNYGADKLEGFKGPNAKIQGAITETSGRLGADVTKSVRDATLVGPHGPGVAADVEHLTKLDALNRLKSRAGLVDHINPMSGLARGTRELNVGSGNRFTRLARLALQVGGAGAGAYVASQNQ